MANLMENYFPASELQTFIKETLELWHVPGLAIAVVQDDQILLCEGYGFRNISKQLPITPDTLFPIASCTKAFTATSIGLLVDTGQLDWDKPVKDYLPTFKLQDAFATEKLTVRDLLSHRSGLPRHDSMWAATHFSRQEIFDRLRYLEPSRDLRQTFQYQNLMYMVAGILVEQIVGTSWERFVQTQILDPLEMVHSNFSTVLTQKTSDFASPYRYRAEQLQEIPFFESDAENNAVGSAGNIISSVREMAKWLQFQINQGKVGDRQIISTDNLEQTHTPHIFIHDPIAKNQFGFEFLSYGLGWEMFAYQGHVYLQHGGSIDGFTAVASVMPHDRLGIVVLSNGDAAHNPVPTIVTQTLADRLLALEPKDWNALLKPLYDQQIEAAKLRQSQTAIFRKPAGPSHPIEAYLGDYSHPGYGVACVKQVDGNLQLVMNEILTLSLEHYHYDIFEAYLEQDDERLKASFNTDLKGTIAQVAIPLEPQVKDILFTRLPDRRLTDPAFLAELVGVYEAGEIQVTIALKDAKTLTAKTLEGPEFNLQPDRGLEFHLQGEPGFGIEFQQNEAGEFTQVILIQPGAASIAKRRS